MKSMPHAAHMKPLLGLVRDAATPTKAHYDGFVSIPTASRITQRACQALQTFITYLLAPSQSVVPYIWIPYLKLR